MTVINAISGPKFCPNECADPEALFCGDDKITYTKCYAEKKKLTGKDGECEDETENEVKKNSDSNVPKDNNQNVQQDTNNNGDNQDESASLTLTCMVN